MAAHEAHIAGEIEALPEGDDTQVGDRGVQLSGGQRQRVALARVLAAGAPVVVLDDPLSAVDASTERAIMASLRRFLAGRTVVLVTHRVAVAALCDQVLVMDQGRVVARGSHEALLARGGLYAAFARRQQLARELAGPYDGGDEDDGVGPGDEDDEVAP